jgi:hypothetical protein
VTALLCVAAVLIRHLTFQSFSGRNERSLKKVFESLKSSYSLLFIVPVLAVVILFASCSAVSKSSVTPVTTPPSTNPPTSVIPQLRSSRVTASYYVSPTGNDTNDGSASAPWKTIKHAAQLVRAGNVVHVAPGTYAESPYPKASGTSDAIIRFVSDTVWGAKVIGDGNTNFGFRTDGDYNSIEGFDITNVNPDGHLGVETNGDFDFVVGNNIHNVNPNGGSDGLGGAGIVNGGDISKGNIYVANNLVHDIGDLTSSSYLVHGIYVGSKGGFVTNNIVYRTQGWGIHLWHAASNITIVNNTVFSNMQGGILVGAGDYPCPQCATNDYTVVTNNIIVNNLAHNINGSTIGGYGVIENGNTGIHNRYENNLVYGNAAGQFSLLNGNAAVATATADPMFMNPKMDGSGDYHLRSGSPAIDAGISVGSNLAYDFDGVARPSTAPWDIGAYEHR